MSALNVLEAIRTRFSCRAFTQQPVDPALVHAILDAARWAGSGTNTQPWHVLILGPESRAKIAERYIAADVAGQKPNPDYPYYPEKWRPPYIERRRACGLALYTAVGIERSDIARRKMMWHENYHFFHAPVAMIFCLESDLATGSFLDMGLFLQNIMLAAKGLGLDTCAQAALAEYPDVVREVLELPGNWTVVCGMALGYADLSHPINQYRIEHLAASDFTKSYP
ncbi:MAG: nitroreductase [Pseudomonadota bacterium]